MGVEPGSPPRASTGTAVMIHAPAALGSGQRREPSLGVGRWLCPRARTRDGSRTGTRQHRCAPKQHRVLRQAASGWLSNQAADPEPAGAARQCARPRLRVRVSGGGEEAPVLERASFWNSPPRPAGTQPRPAGCRRPWRGRLRQARAPRATAPGSSPAPRGQVRRGGRGLRLSGPLPPGRRRWPARQAAPARPRPAPLRNSTQVGSRVRAATLAPSARRRRRRRRQRRRSSGEPRQARRRPHGRARTAGGARAGSSRRRSRRRTRGGAGALPGKVKLEPEAARGRGGPKERRPAPRRAEP